MTQIPSQFEKHIEINDNSTVAVGLLSSETGISKQQIKQIMQKGAVWLTKGKYTQRLRRAKRVLRSGEVLHLYYDLKVLNTEPPEAELISDEGAYSVWRKPYGMLSQGSKWGDHCTIARWAEQHLKPQRVSFVVHRLDRAANGLIIIAHEKRAAVALSGLFQQRQIDKRYRVQVHGKFDEHAVQVTTEIDGRSAISNFSLKSYDEVPDRSLLEVKIETGRKHQIRRHLLSIGYPVVGDRLYGIEGDKEDLQLTAWYLGFHCPLSNKDKYFDLFKSSNIDSRSQ